MSSGIIIKFLKISIIQIKDNRLYISFRLDIMANKHKGGPYNLFGVYH